MAHQDWLIVPVASALALISCCARSGLQVVLLDSDAPALDGGAEERRSFGPVVDVAVGAFHTCAVLADETVWCWGGNGHGQLGRGDRLDRTSPEPVSDLHGVVEVDAGLNHTCVRTRAGEVWCWGWSRDGQVGDGTWTGEPRTPSDTAFDVLRPAQVIDGGVTSIALGLANTYAVRSDGTVVAWGAAYFGSLGDGMASTGRYPTPVPFVGDVAQHAHGACHLTSRGEVRCWGSNERGNVGDGTTEERLRPVAILGATPASFVERASATCAIGRDGTLRCWGDNEVGAVGDGTTTHRLDPVVISGLPPLLTARLGGSESCARARSGEWYCWGYNPYGLFRDDLDHPVDGSLVPQRVAEWDAMADVVIGGSHSCGIRRSDAVVVCVGYNGSGQLGDGTTTDRRCLEPARFP